MKTVRDFTKLHDHNHSSFHKRILHKGFLWLIECYERMLKAISFTISNIVPELYWWNLVDKRNFLVGIMVSMYVQRTVEGRAAILKVYEVVSNKSIPLGHFISRFQIFKERGWPTAVAKRYQSYKSKISLVIFPPAMKIQMWRTARMTK